MKMRVGDPGSFDVDIYLNDEKCDLCIEADEEEGTAEIYFRDYLTVLDKYPDAVFNNIGNYNVDITASIKCKVEIRKREAA